MTLDPETLRWAAHNLIDNDLMCCEGKDCIALWLSDTAATIEELDS